MPAHSEQTRNPGVSFLLSILILTGLLLWPSVISAATYTYAGRTHANGQKSNDWNSASSWTNGPGAFPNGPTDVARTSGNVGGDVGLYLNQDIMLGSLNWTGNVLEIYPGVPAGKLIVDNGGSNATWLLSTPYWCWLNAGLVLSNNLTLSNRTTIGAAEPVRLNGIISGPGRLTLDWYGTYTHTLFIGVTNSTAPNTYAGGTRLQGHATNGWFFLPRKNGAFGNGDVELNGHAILILRDRGANDDYISNSASLRLESTNLTNFAKVDLGSNVNETVSQLFIDGTPQPAGTYGATGSTATEWLDDFFLGAGLLTVTSGPPSVGSISNRPPTSVTSTSATLNGVLTATNAAPTAVWVFWGPTDGARSTAAWSNSVPLGPAGLGPFSTTISGYPSGQTIFYRSFMSNALGGKWANGSVCIGPPAIRNELPYVRTNQVTLRATITGSNGLATTAWVHWGTNDGGLLPANWQNQIFLGPVAQTNLATNIFGLLANTRYYYRFAASNAAGSAWSPTTQSFTTVSPAPYGEITFFVGSDPHYGYTGQTPSCAEVSRGALERMNGLPGQNYPAAAGGGVVGVPRGVLMLGDLTESGTAAEWAAVTNDWGLNGERSLTYPLYEGYGNHDGPNGVVANSIKTRNLSRTGVTNVFTNGLHYSWDWDFLHLVCLNVFPGDAVQTNFPNIDPKLALQFLAQDLAQNVGESGRPVILYHHYGFDSFGLTWWSEQQRADLYNVISNYNVIAFLAGHNHAVGSNRWMSFDTFNDGTLGKSTGNFLALRVTPTNFVAAERTPTNGWGVVYQKSITVPLSNRPPRFNAVSNRTVNAGVTVSVTNTATDPDWPPQQVQYGLLTAPGGTALNPTTGVFTWRPSVTQANLAHPIALTATDNGSNPLSATQSFFITVNPLTGASVRAAPLSNNQLALTISGDSGPDYKVEASSNLSQWVVVLVTNSPAMPFQYTDTNAGNFLKRFYRLLIGP